MSPFLAGFLGGLVGAAIAWRVSRKTYVEALVILTYRQRLVLEQLRAKRPQCPLNHLTYKQARQLEMIRLTEGQEQLDYPRPPEIINDAG